MLPAPAVCFAAAGAGAGAYAAKHTKKVSDGRESMYRGKLRNVIPSRYY